MKEIPHLNVDYHRVKKAQNKLIFFCIHFKDMSVLSIQVTRKKSPIGTYLNLVFK